MEDKVVEQTPQEPEPVPAVPVAPERCDTKQAEATVDEIIEQAKTNVEEKTIGKQLYSSSNYQKT